MGLSPQLFPRTLGEVVAELARQQYPSAKALARAWSIDTKTAENVRDGHAGVRVLAAAISAEGWQFLEALGQTVTGETYEQYQERVLESKIQEVANAHETVVRLRSRREALERRAAGLDDLPRRTGDQSHG